MKRLVWSLVVTTALSVVAVPEASAHGGHHRGHSGYDRHYVIRHSHHYPRWLRHNYDFHRWYRRSHFRHDFYLSWYQLFDIYRYERMFHRPHYYYDRRGRHRHHRHHRHH